MTGGSPFGHLGPQRLGLLHVLHSGFSGEGPAPLWLLVESGSAVALPPDDNQPPVPALVHVRTFWVMRGLSGRPITCALYRTPNGLELRAGQGEQDVLLRQPMPTIAAAETYAGIWKAAAVGKGFRDVDQGRGSSA